MSEKWKPFQLSAIDVMNMTELEYQDLFADMGIGRGIHEYERGKKMLREDTTLDAGEYEEAVKALARWTEV